MSSCHSDHNMARALRVHYGLDDGVLLDLLPVLLGRYGDDRTVWTRETGRRIQQLESNSKEIRPGAISWWERSISIAWLAEAIQLFSSLQRGSALGQLSAAFDLWYKEGA
jgi:hypothetical protein